MMNEREPIKKPGNEQLSSEPEDMDIDVDEGDSFFPGAGSKGMYERQPKSKFEALSPEEAAAKEETANLLVPEHVLEMPTERPAKRISAPVMPVEGNTAMKPTTEPQIPESDLARVINIAPAQGAFLVTRILSDRQGRLRNN